MLRFILVLVLLLIAVPAQAATLAVLPFGKDVGSDEYDGLGTALAGMVVTDLSHVEAITLVERDRLSDVMKEFTLNDTGFVDPQTAQELGKGIGAEFVLTGSWSVIKDELLLNGRVIRVETAQIPKAATAKGAASEFVTVEKELVEQLLDGLELEVSFGERRKMMVETPTESFEAFTAYGEGLKAEVKGEYEQAKNHFSRAVKVDPEFVAAREALSSLRLLAETEQARRREEALDAKARANMRAIEELDAGRIKKGGPTVEQAAILATRWAALRRQGLHCQRAEEMRSFLDAVGWQLKNPDYRAVATATVDQWVAMGMHEYSQAWKPQEPFMGRESYITSGEPQQLGDLANFLWSAIGFIGDDVGKRGYIGSVERCGTPAEVVAELEDLLATAQQQGVADQVLRSTHFTLEQALILQLGWEQASGLGMTPGLSERLKQVAAEVPEEGQFSVLNKLERIAGAGERYEQRALLRLGMEEDEILEHLRYVATAAPEDDWCKTLIPLLQGMASHKIESLESGKQDQDWVVDGAWVVTGPARDLGCLPGLEPRIGQSAATVFGYVQSARKRARADRKDEPECVQGFTSVEKASSEDQLQHANGVMEVHYAMNALRPYYSELVRNRCVEADW